MGTLRTVKVSLVLGLQQSGLHEDVAVVLIVTDWDKMEVRHFSKRYRPPAAGATLSVAQIVLRQESFHLIPCLLWKDI